MTATRMIATSHPNCMDRLIFRGTASNLTSGLLADIADISRTGYSQQASQYANKSSSTIFLTVTKLWIACDPRFVNAAYRPEVSMGIIPNLYCTHGGGLSACPDGYTRVGMLKYQGLSKF